MTKSSYDDLKVGDTVFVGEGRSKEGVFSPVYRRGHPDKVTSVGRKFLTVESNPRIRFHRSNGVQDNNQNYPDRVFLSQEHMVEVATRHEAWERLRKLVQFGESRVPESVTSDDILKALELLGEGEV